MKKLVTMLLCLALAVSTFAGCSGNTESKSPDGSGTASASSTAESGSNAGQEPVKLRALARTSGTNSGWEKVNEEINNYLREKLNVEVTYELATYGDFEQQLNLIVSSGEEIDLISPGMSQLFTFALQGALEPLDELLKSDGQGVLELYDDKVLQSCAIQGSVYAVPTNRDQAQGYVYMYRPEMNEQYDLGLDKATTWDDLEKCFAKFKEQEPDKFCVHASAVTSPFGKVYAWDKLGGNNYGVLMNMGQELKVENLFATELYSEWVHRFRDWYQKGYLPEDALTSTATERDGVTSGNVLGLFMNWKPGMETEATRNNGAKLVKAPIDEGAGGIMSSTSLNNVSWAISKSSKDAKRTMQVMNLMYTDPELINMLCYGLEGENYVFADEAKGIIDYPEGVTSDKQTVDTGTGWQWGNQLLSYVWNGDSPTIWSDMEEFNNNAVRSKALGFVFDPANVQNEMTACANVCDKYAPGLERGVVEPEEVLPEFLSELEAAGIGNIIEEKQSQLDKWLETQK